VHQKSAYVAARTQVCTKFAVVRFFIATHVCCLCIFYFRVRLWVLEIPMDCNRHNGLNHPFRIHLTLSQTQLVEMVTWQVQHIKKQGFRFSLHFTHCKQEAVNNLPALKAWHLVYHTDPFTNVTVNWDVKLSKFVMWLVQPIMWCSAGGKIALGVYILPHKAKQECISCLIK